jgi:hypothetical protein
MKHFFLLIILFGIHVWGNDHRDPIHDLLFEFDQRFHSTVQECTPIKKERCERKIKELEEWVDLKLEGENKKLCLSFLANLSNIASKQQ